MKELSIEEKAKRYDEAIKIARDSYNYPDYPGFIRADVVFPELQESGDERIRKALVKYFTSSISNPDYEICGVPFKEVLAWLEKQGQTFTKKDVDDAYLKGVCDAKHELEKQGEPTEINPSEFDSQLNRLLKQFEALPKEEIASSLSFYLNVIQNDGIYKEEKQGEQKPIDKVEPKFKVGDWVCHTVYKKPLLIVEDLGEGDFRTEPKSIITAKEFREGFYRLWSIQDAKDGDVLACESGWTCIFKELNHNSFGGVLFDSHCFIDGTGWFCDGAKGHTLDERINGKIYPATKEQREQLEKAMADAGYEWDAEKKELKKIEQNPWSEEDEDAIGMAIIALEDMYDEDAPNTTYGGHNLPFNKAAERLKSLKERMQHQNK